MIYIQKFDYRYRVYLCESDDINYVDTKHSQLLGEYKTRRNAILKANKEEREFADMGVKIIKITIDD